MNVENSLRAYKEGTTSMMTALVKALYQIRNWRSHYRALVHGTTTVVENAALSAAGVQVGTLRYSATLSATVIRAEQNRPTNWFKRLFWFQKLDLGIVARRVITTTGVKFLADDFNAGGTEVSNMKFHAMGTDATAEAAADTALGVEVEARTSGTQASATVSPHATYTTTATITATAARLIREHGIFNQLALGGTLWDRSVFGLITLAIGDSILYTYVLTANSGG